jgi:transposase-like protein
MTTRDIRAHLREIYGVEASPELVSRVTDAVVDELQESQARPLDHVFPVIFIDALMVKIGTGWSPTGQAVAGALRRVHPVPGVPARGQAGDLHHEPSRA